ncbi:MAG: hypothetical protein M3041_10040 [Acidobacteriota bacterium]|nr:hypothetical protein [Acidobacteriota bacterium]
MPNGATTGPITVTTPAGTATSATNFVINGPPTITTFFPASGAVSTAVSIGGTNFNGATSVRFNGIAAAFIVSSDMQLSTTVPMGATTGRISVTTPAGTASSATDFTVLTLPVITSFRPASGPVGTVVSVIGNRLGQATRVAFNGASSTFTVVSDALITATVPPGATSGPISVITPSGMVTSEESFGVVIPAPIVAVAALPGGLLTDGTAGATDSYALVNRGTASTTITLTQTGTFFTQAPSSFILDARATQKIVLTANATAGGTFEGSSIPAGNGVPTGLTIPVKMLATPQPPGIPNVHAVTYSVQVVFPISTGSVTLRNDGNGAAYGFLGTDVPWIAFPNNGLVTIAPGQSLTAPFLIDRTKRLDALFGSEVGVVRFIYRATSTSGVSGKTALDTGGSSSVSVTVVSVVPPNSTSTSIPPLAAGEVGLFIPAVPHKDNVTATVSLASVQVQSSDVKLYFIGSGQSGLNQVANLSNLSPSLPRSMFDVVKNVFGQQSGTGSFHVRTVRPDAMALGAMLLDDSSGVGSFGTELSVFRSDQGASAGQDVTLTGLRKDVSTHGDLFLQELSGSPTSLTIQFLDEQGRAIGAARAADNLGPFGSLAIPDVVPPGAVSARITSTGGTGRFIAEAVQVDNVTKDAWNVVDMSRSVGASRSEPVIIPLAVAQQDGNRSMQTDITISNPGATTATARLVYYGPAAGGRRRAVRGNAHAKVQQPLGEQSITVPPQGTVSLQDVVTSVAGTDSRGYFVLTPSSGQLVTTSRTAWKTPGTGASIGTSAPPFAMNATATAGVAKRFVGIEDAGQASVASARPGTFRSSLNLIEAAGYDVTVRITLDYIYPLALVSVQDSRSRDVTVKAHELMQIAEVGQFVIGPDRALISDLHNVTVRVEVIGGNGSVLPFVLATENSSGDLIFRAAN